MEQKRGDFSSFGSKKTSSERKKAGRPGNNKKAQITVFMIVGILLIFLFIFLITMFSDLAKGRLKGEEERILGSIFQKEAMRLYVEDCFNDELQNALLLLGKQGRLWSDQPGGRKNFEEGINGITYNEDERLGELYTGRVFYGLTRGEEDYRQYPQAYPCQDQENPPAFCFYKFPDTSYSFGQLNLKTATITSDLERFLANRTVDCVHQFVHANISALAEIEPSTMELNLMMRDEGISVRAEYPLKFRLAGQEFFHLSEFDFFYPTKFKQLLDAAVAFPLQWDHRFADFNYSENVLLSPVFIYNSSAGGVNCREGNGGNYFCERSLYFNKYQGLSIRMSREELGGGDDLFLFRTPFPNILQIPEDYEFRIARQNRPPALSYVNRSGCPELGYDYLVVKDDPELGVINIELTAVDPDEDEIFYDFSDISPVGEVLGNPFRLGEATTTKDPPELRMEQGFVSELEKGVYDFFAIAEDEHGSKDWQTVRLLIDRPMTSTLKLSMPDYNLRTPQGEQSYDLLFAGGLYPISQEDPFFLKLTLPEQSVIPERAEVNLRYLPDSGGVIPIHQETTERYNDDGETTFTFSFPDGRSSLGDFTDEDIEHQISPLPFTESGLINFDFTVNYCGAEQSDSHSTAVEVRQCVPHYDPVYPNPYVPSDDDQYYRYRYQLNERNQYAPTGIYDEEISPYAASHRCCKFDWTYKEDGAECFTTPPNCDGGIIGWTASRANKGYVLEQQRYYCDGERGNVCGLGEGSGESELFLGRLRCGDPAEYLRCSYNIDENCRRKPAWGMIDLDQDGEGNGWCHGKMGCDDFCETAVVDISGERLTGWLDLNERALRMQTATDSELKFACGCPGRDDGTPCDADFDGLFGGACERGDCHDRICGANRLYCDEGVLSQCNSLGTELTISENCLANDKYCGINPSGEKACLPQVCPPGAAVCFSDVNPELRGGYETWIREEEDGEPDNYVFLCDEEGSGYNLPNECSGGCSRGTTLIKVGGEEGGYECRGCRPGDVSDPSTGREANRCWKVEGGEGVCEQVGRYPDCR